MKREDIVVGETYAVGVSVAEERFVVRHIGKEVAFGDWTYHDGKCTTEVAFKFSVLSPLPTPSPWKAFACSWHKDTARAGWLAALDAFEKEYKKGGVMFNVAIARCRED